MQTRATTNNTIINVDQHTLINLALANITILNEVAVDTAAAYIVTLLHIDINNWSDDHCHANNICCCVVT